MRDDDVVEAERADDRLDPGSGSKTSLERLVSLVAGVWPEHRDYLTQSLALRTGPLMETSERLAQAILQLAAPHELEHAQDYRWLCDVIKAETLDFYRTGKYRYSSFAETSAQVYSDAGFMARYMNGLLLAQVLWSMHASSLHFYRQRVAARVKPGGNVLEVGSGHGLLLFLALSDLGLGSATAWDLSAISLEQTREALRKLGALERARFAVQDMHTAEPGEDRFDLIILSHLLEHLEQPVDALRRVARLLGRGGQLFVNVPLNAPMPDHLILLQKPEDVQEMLSAGGFRIVEFGLHTTQGAPLAGALRSRSPVTCSLIAEPA